MSSWSKAMGTVLGIVLGSFSVAALATLLDETLNVRKQALQMLIQVENCPFQLKLLLLVALLFSG